MSKTSTKAKMEYNRKAYKRYEFSVGVDTKPNYLIENFMKDNSLFYLIKSLLCDYFGVGHIDEIYVPYHFLRGEYGDAAVLEDADIYGQKKR